ncbi:UNVERIFIED_CONTAM: hypothetical protein GTU68_007571, partial [Idotea baltica]|nr:hypothetical protein [Idotea baltica]
MSTLSNKYDAINLGQGFPNFDCHQGLKDRVNHYLQAGKNQYCPMPGVLELRQVLANKIEVLYQRKINPESEVTITAGATQALFTAISTFIKPDDEVIIFEPAYDSYSPSIQLAGGKVIPIKLTAPDYKIDWIEVGAKINRQTKMMIINTPQNPIGRVLSSSDMDSLAAVLEDSNIILLSDEVYEHLIYDGLEHHSVLKYDSLWDRCMAVYSFGKTYHSTGWKLGYVVGPERLMAAFRSVHQWNVYCVNSFIQYGLADFLKDEDQYLGLGKYYQAKRDLFIENMYESSLKPLKSEGTYFQLYDYAEVSDLDDRDFSIWLIKEHGVASIPLSPFYTEGSGDRVVRLCFAK